MEKLHESNNVVMGFVELFISVMLGLLAESAKYVTTHNAEIEVIKLLFQIFAWTGAGLVGVVAVFNFIKSYTK